MPEQDPLARVFLKASPRRPWPILVAALLLNSVLIVGAGFVIGAIYGCGPEPRPFVCISDPRVLIPDILGNIISFSIIWAFYA